MKLMYLFMIAQVFVEMDVFYTAPAIPATPLDESACRSERNSVKGADSAQPSIHGSASGSQHSSAVQSDTDDDHALEDLQRNFAILEQSLQNKETVVDIESGDDTRTRRFRNVGKRFLK